MRTRPATTSDLEAIRTLLQEAELPFDGVSEHLASFLVVEANEGLVAVAGLEVHGHLGLVRSVAVRAARRGDGLGRAVSERLLALARELGLSKLYLLTPTASPFFAKLGFIITPRAEAPQPIRATREFAELCPQSAAFMRLALSKTISRLPAE